MMKIVYGPPYSSGLTVSNGERPPADLLKQMSSYYYSALEVYPVSPESAGPGAVAAMQIRTFIGPNETVACVVLDLGALAAVIGTLQQVFDAAPQPRKE